MLVCHKKSQAENRSARRYGCLFSTSAVTRFRKWLKVIKGNVIIITPLNIHRLFLSSENFNFEGLVNHNSHLNYHIINCHGCQYIKIHVIC